MLDTPTLSLLQSALDYASTRQEALSNNIAIINTAGYVRQDASFSDVLACADSSGGNASLALLRKVPGHLGLGGEGEAAQIVADPTGAMRLDGNNVDMDLEMGRLAKNEIYFQGLSQLISGQFTDLKNVITGMK